MNIVREYHTYYAYIDTYYAYIDNWDSHILCTKYEKPFRYNCRHISKCKTYYYFIFNPKGYTYRDGYTKVAKIPQNY